MIQLNLGLLFHYTAVCFLLFCYPFLLCFSFMYVSMTYLFYNWKFVLFYFLYSFFPTPSSMFGSHQYVLCVRKDKGTILWFPLLHALYALWKSCYMFTNTENSTNIKICSLSNYIYFKELKRKEINFIYSLFLKIQSTYWWLTSDTQMTPPLRKKAKKN